MRFTDSEVPVLVTALLGVEHGQLARVFTVGCSGLEPALLGLTFDHPQRGPDTGESGAHHGRLSVHEHMSARQAPFDPVP